MTPSELYQAGQLAEAIAAATGDVKKHPADINRRGFLCELLCFGGQLERVDKQLETITQQDPQAAVGISLFRQLVRAEIARQQFFDEGRVPEVVDQPSPVIELHLQASIALREGDRAKAAELLDAAEEQRAAVIGTCDDAPFDDFRDLDDLCAPIFEVLTSTGKYYWIPVEKVESIEFRQPKRPRDLLWRPAQMIVRGGPDGEVYLPTIYPGTSKTGDDALSLGRATDWREAEGEPVRGVGLRTFLVGEEDKTILQIGKIDFHTKQ